MDNVRAVTKAPSLRMTSYHASPQHVKRMKYSICEVHVNNVPCTQSPITRRKCASLTNAHWTKDLTKRGIASTAHHTRNSLKIRNAKLRCVQVQTRYSWRMGTAKSVRCIQSHHQIRRNALVIPVCQEKSWLQMVLVKLVPFIRESLQIKSTASTRNANHEESSYPTAPVKNAETTRSFLKIREDAFMPNVDLNLKSLGLDCVRSVIHIQ